MNINTILSYCIFFSFFALSTQSYNPRLKNPIKCTGPNEESALSFINQCSPNSHCYTPICRCKKGFVRKNGVCLKENKMECTKPNEIQSGCLNTCGPDEKCICIPRCVCKPGFDRNANGDCVLKENKCGQNEVYTNCMKNKCPPGMACPAVCRPGCECAPGYFRNSNGLCVQENELMKCEKPNEEYSECASICPPNARCSRACDPGCVCKSGFYRDSNGDCVMKENNIECTGPNERYTDCMKNTCPPGMMCPAVCTPGCECMPGYKRDENGVCVMEYEIRKRSVPAFECNRPNEEYSPFVNPCPPRILCRAPWLPGCVCKPGFVRVKGVCVKK